MRLVFSEAEPDYSRYQYPYVVWGIPEAGETPADLFAAGFMPASPHLDRFTLARHLRVPLAGWRLTSENRRVVRKGAGLTFALASRGEFDYSEERRGAWLRFAEERFGEGVMPASRLDTLMASRAITHLLSFRTGEGGEVGTVLMYLEPPAMAFYYYAFYDLGWADRGLGMYMMTAAVEHFARLGYGMVYLGTCYSGRALYKTQFRGVEFFNGFRWSADVGELKAILRRDTGRGHLLQDPGFLERYGGLETIVGASPFRGGR